MPGSGVLDELFTIAPEGVRSGPGDGMVYDDPRDIAFVAYRHLAKRLTRGES